MLQVVRERSRRRAPLRTAVPTTAPATTSPAPTSAVVAGARRITVPILPLSCATPGPGIYGYRIQALGADGQIVAQSELVAITAA